MCVITEGSAGHFLLCVISTLISWTAQFEFVQRQCLKSDLDAVRTMSHVMQWMAHRSGRETEQRSSEIVRFRKELHCFPESFELQSFLTSENVQSLDPLSKCAIEPKCYKETNQWRMQKTCMMVNRQMALAQKNKLRRIRIRIFDRNVIEIIFCKARNHLKFCTTK